jgi:hypothetical protein
MNSTVFKAAILQILKERDDEPSSEKYLMLALNVQYRIKPTWTELRSALKDMDEKGFLVGTRPDGEDLAWGLSTKGRHKASSI